MTLGLLGSALIAQTGIVGAPLPALRANSDPAIEVRVAPLQAQYCWLRVTSLHSDQASEPERVRQARAHLREIAARVQREELWAPIVAPFVRCGNSADYFMIAENLPETLEVGRSRLEQRAMATQLAMALNASESHFLAKVWPEQHKLLCAERDRLTHAFGSKMGPCLEALRKDLEVSATAIAWPVYLVPVLPTPGPIAVASSPHHGFCMLGLHDRHGAQVLEGLLQASLLSLEPLAVEHSSLVRLLVVALAAQGMPQDDPKAQSAARTLIEVASAAVVTRLVDPKYVACGETNGAYAGAETISGPLRKLWPEVLAGKRPRAEIVTEIANTIVKLDIPSTPPRALK